MFMLERLLLLTLSYLFGKKIFQVAALFSAQWILIPIKDTTVKFGMDKERCLSLLKRERVIVEEKWGTGHPSIYSPDFGNWCFQNLPYFAKCLAISQEYRFKAPGVSPQFVWALKSLLRITSCLVPPLLPFKIRRSACYWGKCVCQKLSSLSMMLTPALIWHRARTQSLSLTGHTEQLHWRLYESESNATSSSMSVNNSPNLSWENQYTGKPAWRTRNSSTFLIAGPNQISRQQGTSAEPCSCKRTFYKILLWSNGINTQKCFRRISPTKLDDFHKKTVFSVWKFLGEMLNGCWWPRVITIILSNWFLFIPASVSSSHWLMESLQPKLQPLYLMLRPCWHAI